MEKEFRLLKCTFINKFKHVGQDLRPKFPMPPLTNNQILAHPSIAQYRNKACKILILAENCPNPANYFYDPILSLNRPGSLTFFSGIMRGFGIYGSTPRDKLISFLTRGLMLLDTYTHGPLATALPLPPAQLFADIQVLNPTAIIVLMGRVYQNVIPSLVQYELSNYGSLTFTSRIVHESISRKNFYYPFPGNGNQKKSEWV